MHVINTHERIIHAPRDTVAALLDGLASGADRLWPRDRWPAMRFDRPLGVGAIGGHGPIRYTVETYEPGTLVRFRFTMPKGFQGSHRFECETVGVSKTRLRHVIEMEAKGPAVLTWPLMIRPLHDALIEDALDRAEAVAGAAPSPRPWSRYVRFLRALLRRK
jgi:hypothetical protein